MARFIKVHEHDGDEVLVNMDLVIKIKGVDDGAFFYIGDVYSENFLTQENMNEVADIVARSTGIISKSNQSRTSGVE